MENILSYISGHVELKDIISYFSCELVLLFGAVINLILLIFRKKINIRKISKIITVLTLGLSILTIPVIYVLSLIGSDGYGTSLLTEYFEPGGGSFFLKILINIFILFFVLTNYGYIKKFGFKVAKLNSISLLLALCGCLILQAGSYILTYLLLEVVAILVYKFASNMRIKKFSVFSSDYIILSLSATIIFFAFYILRLNTDKVLQMSIINICLSIAVLMKIGIFPFYNFLILKSSKINMPFSLLLFGYLPWIGVLAFNKMSNIIMPSDEIYQISMIAFIIVSLVTFAFYASKHKNLIKFFANFSYFVNGLCILSVIYFQADKESVWLSTLFSFGLIGLYSLIALLKSNYKLEKINVANLSGIFLNNRLFAFLFSGILIMMTGLIPSGIMKALLKTLKNIYLYDKTGFLAVCAIVCLMLLILFNGLKIVRNIYTFEKGKSLPSFTKRTTLYYVVPVLVFTFLLLKTIL